MFHARTLHTPTDRRTDPPQFVSSPVIQLVDAESHVCTNAHPLYQYLKSEKPGILGTEAIKWNFTKFLVGADGTVLKRYASNDKPEMIEADLATKL